MRRSERERARVIDGPAGGRAFARDQAGILQCPDRGVSVAGSLFAFFWTNHCAYAQDLHPDARHPLTIPTPDPHQDPKKRCPEQDPRTSVGISYLARSDDAGQRFTGAVRMPPGFVYAVAVNAQSIPDLPAGEKLGVYIFALPRYRASIPYLAVAPEPSFNNPSTWRFFSGRTPSGDPMWISAGDWSRMIQNVPPNGPEIIDAAGDNDRVVGEFSMTWNRVLGEWLMVYTMPNSDVVARVAAAPWGPWSAPTVLLSTDEDRVACRYISPRKSCPASLDYQPDTPTAGLYAPYVLERYTTEVRNLIPGQRTADIYYIVSTWNPYQVTLLRTRPRQ